MATNWGAPVRVLIGSNTAYNVTTLEKAAELLLDGWPDQGARSRRAREAILRAADRPGDPGTLISARMAFEAAARAADILLERRPDAQG